MKGTGRIRRWFRDWRTLALGIIMGLLISNVVFEASAQTIVDPNLPAGLSDLSQDDIELLQRLRSRSDEIDSRLEAVRTGEASLQTQLEELELHLIALREGQSGECVDSELDLSLTASDGSDGSDGDESLDDAAAAELTAAEEAAARSESERAVRLAEMSRTLTSMNRNNAALVLSELEPSLAVEVLAQLSPRDAGRILDRMSPEEAADLSERIIHGDALDSD